MPNDPRFHPVYKSINKTLTIWGMERRLFFLALIMGGATFNLFGSLLSGLLMSTALFLLARWATATDPQILRILLNSSRLRTQYDPGRLSVDCWSVENLIFDAYLVNANGSHHNPASVARTPIEGGPAWLGSDRYSINAKPEEPEPEEMLRGPMLQALLEERFKLKIHFRTTEIPVYELTVAKSGLKLRPFHEGSCRPIDLKGPRPPREPGQCALKVTSRGATLVVEMQGLTIDEFIDMHIGRVDRPVVNKTGIAGRFDFHLEYVPDERTGGSPPGEFADEVGPSMFSALQQQLGLNLGAAKGSGRVLVIDHIERPTEN